MKIFLGILVGLVVLGIVAVGSAFLYYQNALKPVATAEQDQDFIVPKGQAVAVIANRLQEEGFIRNSYALRIYLKQADLENKIQAGTFSLSPSNSTQEIAIQLTQGTQDTWITLLEGWRTEEIAQYLSAQDLPAFNEAEFLDLAESSEGKLFPETYLVPKESTAEAIFNMLVATFEQKVSQGLATEISNSNRDFEDVLIMASLVEREARGYEQMRHVAGILWNRVDIGMALNVDATLQYIRGYDAQKQSWWSPPSVSYKENTSLYNTYQYPGLPPAPIANPGLEAIRATLDPLEVDDLFYLHAPDGTMYYAKDLDGHNQNVNKYLR